MKQMAKFKGFENDLGGRTIMSRRALQSGLILSLSDVVENLTG